MRSIQTHLTLGLTLVMFAISIASGGALTSWLRHAMSAEFDQSLLVNAHALQSLVALRPDGSMDVDVNLRSLGEFTGRSATDYFEFEDLDGHQIAASDHAVIRGPSDAHSTFWNAQLPNGVAARAMQITFQPAPEADEDEPASGPTIKLATPTLRLVVAHDRRPLDSILSRMTLAVGAATLVFSAVAVVASVLMVRRGLSSLRMLATEVAAADVTKAPVHFSTAERPTELVPIVGRLNELLDRVSVALTRERQFTAAVSHELRTPIAELRSIADISLREPDDVPLARRAVVQSHEIALQMQTLVSTLLSIVAVGRSGESVAITDTPVRPLLERAIEKRSADFRARAITVTSAVPTDVIVQANPTLLAGMFDNVLGNAVQYATAGSEVVVDLQLLSDHTVFTFSNQQDGLGKEDISRVFDPFWRKDAARSSGEHVGLGLALVQTYAKAMDGVVSATLTDDDRYSISIRLPRTATELHDLAPAVSNNSSRGGLA